MKLIFSVFLSVITVVVVGCGKDPQPQPQAPPPQVSSAAPVYSYEVVNTFPHNPTSFTEGLEFYHGELYESTGLNGHSTLQREELTTGKILQKIDIPSQYFGEGIVIFGDKIYQLTYTTQTGFIYDLKTFNQLSTWHYSGEGWALTTDGTSLIMSDGTDKIKFIDPATQSVTKTIQVQESGMPVLYVNELEYIKGEIWANVWQTTRIVRIDPVTGDIKGWIDLSGLLSPSQMQNVDVLNGIAYDSEHDRIFVTGKYWPSVFEIKIKSEKTPS